MEMPKAFGVSLAAPLPKPQAPRSRLGRNAAVALGVVALHAVALVSLQLGLLQHETPAEVIVPARILAQTIVPAPRQAEPAPPAPKPPEHHVEPRPKRAVTPAPKPIPRPQIEPAPSQPAPPPSEPVTAAAPAPATPPAPAAPSAPPAPAAPEKVELPSSTADYLRNPQPPYPAASRRLGEQGKVLLRVLIDVDGSPKEAQIRQSSGFARLDKAALETVRTWRFVPGKRAGVPQAMWFNVPINFVLE